MLETVGVGPGLWGMDEQQEDLGRVSIAIDPQLAREETEAPGDPCYAFLVANSGKGLSKRFFLFSLLLNLDIGMVKRSLEMKTP